MALEKLRGRIQDRFAKGALRGLIRRTGFDIVRFDDVARDRTFTSEDVDIIRSAKPFTMTTPERLFALVQAVRYVVKYRVPGDVVECGVWKGGSMLAAAQALRAAGDESRHLYLFDTFEGMPSPSPDDVFRGNRRATDAYDRGTNYASLDEVKRTLQGAGYDSGKVHFVKGLVEDTVAANAPDTISILRLDTDWYESTLHELNHLFPRLAKGGVLIIDDYGDWEGARKATDQYFSEHPEPMLLNRIDSTGRIGVKL